MILLHETCNIWQDMDGTDFLQIEENLKGDESIWICDNCNFTHDTYSFHANVVLYYNNCM